LLLLYIVMLLLLYSAGLSWRRTAVHTRFLLSTRSKFMWSWC